MDILKDLVLNGVKDLFDDDEHDELVDRIAGELCDDCRRKVSKLLKELKDE